MSDSSDPVTQFVLYARRVSGAENSFLVTSTPPQDESPGVCVQLIPNLDDGSIGAALLREHSEMYADSEIICVNWERVDSRDDSAPSPAGDPQEQTEEGPDYSSR